MAVITLFILFYFLCRSFINELDRRAETPEQKKPNPRKDCLHRAGAYGAAGTAMAVPLFWSRQTILRVKIEQMELVGYAQIFRVTRKSFTCAWAERNKTKNVW